jgi:outer membrane protein assembly factor BamA
MLRKTAPSLAALVFVAAAFPAISQSFQAKSIQFAGAPGYSDQELLGTIGATPGTTLGYAEMNRAAQKLVDTGMFSSASFKFDGQNLIFQLAPATGLLPLRLQNLPFPAGKDLDEKLHRQFALYHGLLPEQGGLTESVRGALEKMLAAQNITASVTAMPWKDSTSQKPTAVSFAIASPNVLVGDLRTEGAVVALDPKASAILAKYAGAIYDAERSAKGIEADFTAYYKDQGYPEPAIHAIASGKPIVTASALRIPMKVSIVPGPQYKLARIQLAPDVIVSQADFDRQFPFRAGDVADGERLRAAWKFIEAKYHDRGYVKAKIQPAVTIDHTNKTASYLVTADPGPVYTMGSLAIDNVTDDLRMSMLSAWKLPAGAVFNESVISGFFNTHGANPALEQVFSSVNYHYTLAPNDATHTVDVKLALEKKP